MAKDCPDSVTIVHQMMSNFSSAIRSASNTFEAKCEDGYAFFRENNGYYTAYTTKIGKCTYDINIFDIWLGNMNMDQLWETVLVINLFKNEKKT